MKYIKYIEDLKNKMMNDTLIEIVKSDRYDTGDTDFKHRFNHTYIQEYVVIDGVDKEKYINKQIQQYIDSSKTNMENDLKKFKETFIRASNHFDMTNYIEDIKNLIGKINE